MLLARRSAGSPRVHITMLVDPMHDDTPDDLIDLWFELQKPPPQLTEKEKKEKEEADKYESIKRQLRLVKCANMLDRRNSDSDSGDEEEMSCTVPESWGPHQLVWDPEIQAHQLNFFLAYTNAEFPNLIHTDRYVVVRPEQTRKDLAEQCFQLADSIACEHPDSACYVGIAEFINDRFNNGKKWEHMRRWDCLTLLAVGDCERIKLLERSLIKRLTPSAVGPRLTNKSEGGEKGGPAGGLGCLYFACPEVSLREQFKRRSGPLTDHEPPAKRPRLSSYPFRYSFAPTRQ